MKTKKDKLLDWLVNGEVGRSSKRIASVASCGKAVQNQWDHPHDPDDLRRCLMLVEQIPEVREDFPTLAQCSPEWKAIVDHWDELVALLKAEGGPKWSTDMFTAAKTYARMKELCP